MPQRELRQDLVRGRKLTRRVQHKSICERHVLVGCCVQVAVQAVGSPSIAQDSVRDIVQVAETKCPTETTTNSKQDNVFCGLLQVVSSAGPPKGNTFSLTTSKLWHDASRSCG